jgi:hypothetical protein
LRTICRRIAPINSVEVNRRGKGVPTSRLRKRGYPAQLPARIAYGPGQNKQSEFLAMPMAAKKATAHGANPTHAVSHLADVTDRMHGLLMARAGGRAHGLHREQPGRVRACGPHRCD